MILKTIINKIDSLPPLPSTLKKIEKIANDPKKTIGDLIETVQKDPMLSADLLKVANSPLYGFQKEIKTISQAVSLFGMNMTKILSLSFTVRQLLNTDMTPYGINFQKFAEISHIQAKLAKEIYQEYYEKDSENGDKIFSMALLQEIGKILIANEIMEREESKIFKEIIKSSINIEDVEKSFVGCTSCEIGARILKRWNLDQSMIDSIYYACDYQNAPDDIKNYSLILKVVKEAVSINSPLSENSLERASLLLKREGFETDCFFKKAIFLKGIYFSNYALV